MTTRTSVSFAKWVYLLYLLDDEFSDLMTSVVSVTLNDLLPKDQWWLHAVCRREIITVRGQSYVLRLPKYWPPTPLSERRVCTPRLCCGGRTHSPGGEGGGGSIFWKTRYIGLPSYSNNLSTSRAQAYTVYMYIQRCRGRCYYQTLGTVEKTQPPGIPSGEKSAWNT